MPRVTTEPESNVSDACEIRLPAVWQGIALLALGVAGLLALVGGDLPASDIRQLTAIACVAFTLVALLATFRRCSALVEVCFFDSCVAVAFFVSAFAAFRSPIRGEAMQAVLWQACLVGVYMGGRLIGPCLIRPAMLLWIVATVGLWALRLLAAQGNVPERFLVAPEVIPRAVLLESALAIFIIAVCWVRKLWAKRQPDAMTRSMRRVFHWGAVAVAVAAHFMLISGGNRGALWEKVSASWHLARALFWQFPVWGWGGGTLEYALRSLPDPSLTEQTSLVLAPVMILTAGGLAGLFAVIILAGGVWINLMAVKRGRRVARRGTPLLVAVSLVVMWGVMGLWSAAPVRPFNLILLAFITGAGFSMDLVVPVGREPMPTPTGSLRLFIWSAAIGVGVFHAALLVLTPALTWWITRAPTPDLASQRAETAGKVIPWDARWPAMEAHTVGLWIISDLAGGNEELKRKREQAYLRARVLNPYEPEFTTIPAEEMMLRGQDDRAETLLREALERTPLDASVIWDLTLLLQDRGEIRGALETLEPLDRLHPTGPSKVTLARLWWDFGERVQAERCVREALQIGNRSPVLQALMTEMGLDYLDERP